MLWRSLRSPVYRTCVRLPALLLGAWLCATVASAQVTDDAGLRQRILDANDGLLGDPATITIDGSFALTGSLPIIQASINFVGGGFTISRDPGLLPAVDTRVFTIVEGTVTISNLTIAGARAVGGAGGAGGFPGGGGAGIGAAIFVGNGATLTTTNLTIQDAAAQGGAGGALTAGGGGGGGGFAGAGGATLGLGGGGGGGFAGAGGVGGVSGGGGGGGGLLVGAGGGAGAVGGGGGGGRGASGGAGADGGGGMSGGGGGGGGVTVAGAPAVGDNGGAGGPEGGNGGSNLGAGLPGADDGGGGGGGGDAVGGAGARRSGGGGGGADVGPPNGNPLLTAGGASGSAAGGGGAGSGGIGGGGSEYGGGGGGGATGGTSALFGGGGGGTVTGGNAVFGGAGAGGTTPGIGPFGGPGNGALDGAGGGSAAGGAIFVEEGGTLTMTSPTFTGTFTVTPGAATPGSIAQGGVAQGTVVFTQGGTGGLPLTLDVPTALTIPGAGALAGGGPYRKIGAGTLTVAGSNPNAAGAFTVTAGALAGGADDSFGTGSLVGDGGDLMASGGARNFANPVTLLAGGLNVTGTQDVTLSGVVSGTGVLSAAMAPASTLTLAGTNLHTVGGTTAVSGILAATADANLGGAGVPLTLNGGTFRPFAATTFARPLVLAAGGGIFDTNNFATLWSGPVSGAILNKGGLGALTLSGVNTFSAANIVGGTLAVNGGAAVSDQAAIVVGVGATFDVLFTEEIGSLSGAGSVVLTQTLLSGANNVSTAFAGAMSGAGAFVKTGTGTLTLTTANGHAGGTMVSGGSIATLIDASLGGGASALTLNGGALQALSDFTLARPLVLGPTGGTMDTLVSTLTTSGTISGAGGLIKAGPGILLLNAAASHTGPTTIGAGTLGAGAANVFSAASVHTVNPGTILALNGHNQTLGSVAGTGTVSLGSGRLTLATANTQSFDGAITGTGGLTAAGTGALTLNGAQAYSGSTIVAGGTVTIPGSLASSLVQVTGGALQVTGSLAATSIDVTGGSLTASGGAAIADTVALTINAPGTATFNASETIGTLSGSGSLSLPTGTALTVGGTNASSTFSGIVSGAGALTKAGTGTLTLSGANTFDGGVSVNAGTISVFGGAALADSTPVTVAAGAVLSLGASETIGPLNGSGSVQLQGSTLTLGGAGSFAGIISGTGGVVKAGTGMQTLAGVNTYAGPTSLTGGTLLVTGTIPTLTTVSAGTLSGSGTVTGVTLTGGEIRPSSILTVNGNLNVGASATFASTVNGPSPNTEYGQVRVNGTVTLAGTLNVTLGFSPGSGTSFVLIDNDGSDAVSGTFAGLAEGATLNVNGAVLTITYTGGTGNDVMLLAALFTTYLAEGATNAFFDVRIALVNPSATDTANVTLRFLTSVPSTVTSTLTLPPLARRTVNPETIPGLENANFSTVIESNVRVVVDRTMSWDATGYGSHAETSTGAPATVWYFAEGATHGLFDLFYLLQNATTSPAEVEITYLRPAPEAPIVRTYTVAPSSRQTIYVDQEDAGLAATDVSAVIRVTNAVPISTERAMYLSTGTQAFAAGTDVSGIAAPSASWFFAEGATGPFFDFFLLLANPQATEAAVTITYATSAGGTVTRQYTVAANSRRTISVEQEDPLLENAAIAATVTVTNAVEILAERAIFWPAFPWHEGHASAGVTATGTRWALAEGEAGGAAETQTYILIANTGSSAATVRVTLLLEAGSTLQREYTIPANSRFNVNTGVDFPDALNQRFGALVESLGATPQPLVVERSMYTNADGVVWAAGTNALATRLQ